MAGNCYPFFVESYSTGVMRIPVMPESGRYGANFVCVIERKFVPYKDSELPLKASLESCRVTSFRVESHHSIIAGALVLVGGRTFRLNSSYHWICHTGSLQEEYSLI